MNEVPPGLPADLVNALIRADVEKDSIEIGTPSKGGGLKVYFDAHDLEAAKAKIRTACEALAFASELLRGATP